MKLIEDLLYKTGLSAIIYSPILGIFSMYKDREAKLMIHDAIKLEMEADRMTQSRAAEYLSIKNNNTKIPGVKKETPNYIQWEFH